MSWFRRATPDKERRRAPRYPICIAVRVLLPDSMKSYPAHMADISDFGTVLELRELLPYGARVCIDVREYRLWGIGHIRRCTGKGHRFSCGVEFQGPLTSYPLADNFSPRTVVSKDAAKGFPETVLLDGGNPD